MESKTEEKEKRTDKMLIPSFISLSTADFTHKPEVGLRHLPSRPFSPSSNINQQA